nr:hypothetical protein [Serratia marcescens]
MLIEHQSSPDAHGVSPRP